MIIGALGDAHGGKFLDPIPDLPAQLADVDLLLLAGDIADSNDLGKFERVRSRIRGATNAPIVAVFGNDEYEQSHPDYRTRFMDVTFLDDEAAELEIKGLRIRIVGTTGSLDRPTWWQRTNLPHIWVKYRDRVKKVSELLSRKDSDILILLSHYAPTYLTLKGEREKAFPEMGSKALERVLWERRPDLVIHAHAHGGTRVATLRKEQTRLDELKRDEVKIYNVSLPLVKKVTRFEVEGDGAKVRLHE